MTSGTAVVDERPVFFEVDGNDLFGIVTVPEHPVGVGAVLLSGASWTPSPGRNRSWVRLAARLAEVGMHAIRIDYRGVGESSGELPAYRLDDPVPDDVVGAAACLTEHGASEIVLLGNCFGGRAALAAAERIPGLRGVALYASPMRDHGVRDRIAALPLSWHVRRAVRLQTLRRLLDPAKRREYRVVLRRKLSRMRSRADQAPGAPAGPSSGWTSPLLVEQLRAVVERGVPVLFVFGDADVMYDEWKQGMNGPLGDVVRDAGDLVTVWVEPGQVHGLRTTDVQELVIDGTLDWLSTVGIATLASGARR